MCEWLILNVLESSLEVFGGTWTHSDYLDGETILTRMSWRKLENLGFIAANEISERLVKTIQWFRTHTWWKAAANSGLWPVNSLTLLFCHHVVWYMWYAKMRAHLLFADALNTNILFWWLGYFSPLSTYLLLVQLSTKTSWKQSSWRGERQRGDLVPCGVEIGHPSSDPLRMYYRFH